MISFMLLKFQEYYFSFPMNFISVIYFSVCQQLNSDIQISIEVKTSNRAISDGRSSKQTKSLLDPYSLIEN